MKILKEYQDHDSRARVVLVGETEILQHFINNEWKFTKSLSNRAEHLVIKGDSQPVLAAKFVNLVVRDENNEIIMVSATLSKPEAKALAENFEFTEMVTPEEGRILKMEMC